MNSKTAAGHIWSERDPIREKPRIYLRVCSSGCQVPADAWRFASAWCLTCRPSARILRTDPDLVLATVLMWMHW